MNAPFPIRSRRAAGWFGALLVLLVFAPFFQNFRTEPSDGFPLSYFPMFSNKRDEDLRVTHVVGLSAEGERYVIPHWYVAPGGMNTARKQLRRLVRDGAAQHICADVARHLAQERPAELEQVRHVMVVTADYQYERFFQGDLTPAEVAVHASCDVAR